MSDRVMEGVASFWPTTSPPSGPLRRKRQKPLKKQVQSPKFPKCAPQAHGPKPTALEPINKGVCAGFGIIQPQQSCSTYSDPCTTTSGLPSKLLLCVPEANIEDAEALARCRAEGDAWLADKACKAQVSGLGSGVAGSFRVGFGSLGFRVFRGSSV